MWSDIWNISYITSHYETIGSLFLCICWVMDSNDYYCYFFAMYCQAYYLVLLSPTPPPSPNYSWDAAAAAFLISLCWVGPKGGETVCQRLQPEHCNLMKHDLGKTINHHYSSNKQEVPNNRCTCFYILVHYHCCICSSVHSWWQDRPATCAYRYCYAANDLLCGKGDKQSTEVAPCHQLKFVHCLFHFCLLLTTYLRNVVV